MYTTDDEKEKIKTIRAITGYSIYEIAKALMQCGWVKSDAVKLLRKYGGVLPPKA